jgi:ATP-dependent Lon protease
MEGVMNHPQFAPCPVCGEKMPTVIKGRPCSACGCTTDDPQNVLFDANRPGSKDFDLEQFLLAFPADEKIDDAEPASSAAEAEWTREEFLDFSKKKKLARAYARKSGKALLFEDISCTNCSNQTPRSETARDGSAWRIVCRVCSQVFNVDELEEAVLEIEKFADYETQFLKANPAEAEASMLDWTRSALARALKEKAAEELRNDRKMVAVFPEKQLQATLEGAVLSGDGDEKSRIRLTMKRLMVSSGFRPLAVPGPAWQAEVEELQENFPNFSSAISDVVAPSMAIAAAGGRARPAPLLLVGPPGVGKSYFAEALSKILGVPRAKIDMASATIGATIGGLSTHWSNAGPGEVFKLLAFGRGGVEAVANPLIFLDEIDKVGKDMRYDPLGPLYTLLEFESAKSFEDESLSGLEIDASHIRWIMCANETDPIPKPIMSRVHVVNVREPTEAELRIIRARIFIGVVNGLTIPDFEDWIPPAVLNGAGNQGPREFKNVCVMAIGKALANGKYRVREKDFESGAPVPARKIGFM